MVLSLSSGSRFGLFEADKPFSTNISQLFDPALHVQIDGLEPYVCTGGSTSSAATLLQKREAKRAFHLMQIRNSIEVRRATS